ncbi:recombinase family protein [Siphonobacter sp. SORGH_AS_1065]|uniref:recombinase family protein n=1 Tax=Siphonobacter sp. SORGH_AS_1065 TaxID=3041795 RepID=UPI002787C6E9|nr:recombinase family protein [Siphonobacter sp. SORGH_AS_1065]MDQ1090200.1 DNA invertase Pin-like site-specific DNA recombinase [Siphonobacter sp. SORGH_AS_1065]
MQYVAYYRVSTVSQGKSGLGLSAQQEIVRRFVRDGETILEEFTEVESGKKSDRPQLKAAIAFAKEKRARLLIAKLDRLSRNAEFIFTLRNAEVDFVACDIPDANTLTIGIMAVLAQHERELISERTRNALRQKKRLGFTLGKPENLTEEAISKGRELRIENAKTHQANRQAAELARLYRAQGHTYTVIAEKLNNNGFRTRRGKLFHAMTVQRLVLRFT